MAALSPTDVVSPSDDLDVLSIGTASDISSLSEPPGTTSGPSAQPSDKDVEVTVQHDAYYLDIDYIKFQAGNVVFRTHAYFFARESDEARAVVEQSRSSPDRLVMLEELDPQDLECFFKVLYCRVSDRPDIKYEREWTSVLHLSHLWNFSSMHNLAIRELSDLTTPVDRIVLGRKYGIDHWLPPAYVQVCEREECISDEEGRRLGLEEVLKISRAWRMLRGPATLKYSATERAQKIGDIFGLIGSNSNTMDHDDLKQSKDSSLSDSGSQSLLSGQATQDKPYVPPPNENSTVTRGVSQPNDDPTIAGIHSGVQPDIDKTINERNIGKSYRSIAAGTIERALSSETRKLLLDIFSGIELVQSANTFVPTGVLAYEAFRKARSKIADDTAFAKYDVASCGTATSTQTEAVQGLDNQIQTLQTLETSYEEIIAGLNALLSISHSRMIAVLLHDKSFNFQPSAPLEVLRITREDSL